MRISRLLFLILRSLRYPVLLWGVLAAIWFILPVTYSSANTELLRGRTRTVFHSISQAYSWRFTEEDVPTISGPRNASYEFFDLQFSLDSPTKGPKILSISGQYNIPLSSAVSRDMQMNDDGDYISDVFWITTLTVDGIELPALPEADGIQGWRLFFQPWIAPEECAFPLRFEMTRRQNHDESFTLRVVPDSGIHYLPLTTLKKKIAPSPILTVEFENGSFRFIEGPYVLHTSTLLFVRIPIITYLACIAIVAIAFVRFIEFGLPLIRGLFFFIFILFFYAGIVAVVCGLFWWYTNGQPSISVSEAWASMREGLAGYLNQAVATSRQRAEASRAAKKDDEQVDLAESQKGDVKD